MLVKGLGNHKGNWWRKWIDYFHFFCKEVSFFFFFGVLTDQHIWSGLRSQPWGAPGVLTEQSHHPHVSATAHEPHTLEHTLDFGAALMEVHVNAHRDRPSHGFEQTPHTPATAWRRSGPISVYATCHLQNLEECTLQQSTLTRHTGSSLNGEQETMALSPTHSELSEQNTAEQTLQMTPPWAPHAFSHRNNPAPWKGFHWGGEDDTSIKQILSSFGLWCSVSLLPIPAPLCALPVMFAVALARGDPLTPPVWCRFGSVCEWTGSPLSEAAWALLCDQSTVRRKPACTFEKPAAPRQNQPWMCGCTFLSGGGNARKQRS